MYNNNNVKKYAEWTLAKSTFTLKDKSTGEVFGTMNKAILGDFMIEVSDSISKYLELDVNIVYKDSFEEAVGWLEIGSDYYLAHIYDVYR